MRRMILLGSAGAVPIRNLIDRRLFAKIEQDGIPRAALRTDEEFLRRLHLDVTGRLPETAKVTAFLADRSPDKRDKEIDSILASPYLFKIQKTKAPFLDRQAVRMMRAAVLLLSAALSARAGDYTAAAVTPANSFTDGIEGPACDAQGNLYAVSYEREGTIGRMTPDGKTTLWAVVPNGGRVNGMRLDSEGKLIGADYINHIVHRIDPASARFEENLTAGWQGPPFHQPNDVGITANDTIYFTDPNWKHEAGLGRLFRITPPPNRETVLIEEGLRGPNGVTLSPDDKRVYVGQSRGGNVLVYDRAPDGSLSNKREFFNFVKNGLPADGVADGIRCDARGRVFITLVYTGRILIVNPDGKLSGTIRTLGSRPANLTFCGRDGRTLYITEKEHGRIEKVRVRYKGVR